MTVIKDGLSCFSGFPYRHDQACQLMTHYGVLDREYYTLNRLAGFNHDIFDFSGIHAVPAYLDLVVLSPDHIEIPVLIPISQVAGVIAVLVEDLFGRLVIFIVPEHDIRAPGDKFARLAGSQRLPYGGHDDHGHSRNR